MEIVSYNRLQLSEFIGSDLFRRLDRIPISPRRAVSHIHNPDCDDDDILLWAAYDREKLAGYAGVLPGLIREGGKPGKIYWLSCFWVDEPYRSQNLASALFFPLVKRYRDRLCISNFVPSLERTYAGLGIFHPPIVAEGTRFYVNFCMADLAKSRFPAARRFSGLFRTADGILNFLLLARIPFAGKTGIPSSVMEDSHFDEEFDSLLDRNSGSPFIREARHFEWILSRPWVLEGKPDADSRRYYFSSTAAQFGYIPLKVYQGNQLTGFSLLKIRDRALAVSYIFADEDAISDLAGYIRYEARRKRLNTITTTDPRLAGALKKRRSWYLFLKTIKRTTLVAKKLSLTSGSFQEGDGDSVFT